MDDEIRGKIERFLLSEKIREIKKRGEYFRLRFAYFDIMEKQRELEERYNHNHDSKGRFTFAHGSGLTGNGESDKLNTTPMYRKSDEKDQNNKYISVQRINQLTVEARINGAQIIINEPWFNKRLKENNASAVTYGNIIVFGEKVTVSDVLEECHHFFQNKNNMNGNIPEPLRTYLNEIDAKEYLLRSAAKYKIPRNETELTQKQLISYRQKRDEYYKENSHG